MAAVSTTPSLSGEKEMRIVLLGNTGTGKSATGNSILMQEVFKENDDPIAGTSEAITRSGDPFHSGRVIRVTDTPGLHSTILSDEMMCKHIFQFIGQICPGPHAIIIVMSVKSRVSLELKNAVEIMSEVLGEKSTEYIIFVFTNVDTIRSARGKPPTPIKEWVDKLTSQDVTMKKMIVQKCRERYVAFNNNIDLGSEDNKSQVRPLIDMIETMLRHNGDVHFTSQVIQEVEKIMKDLDEKTGSRTTSRDVLSGVLGISLVGAAGSGTVTALEVGVQRFGTVTEIASGAALGLAAAAPGVVAVSAIAGITIAGWKLFKSMVGKVFGDAKTAIKKYKPKP